VFAVVGEFGNRETTVASWRALPDLEGERFPGGVPASRMGDGGRRLAFQNGPERRATKDRMHLALTDDRRRVVAARVLEIGGSRPSDHQGGILLRALMVIRRATDSAPHPEFDPQSPHQAARVAVAAGCNAVDPVTPNPGRE
jgi:hypothetical protein